MKKTVIALALAAAAATAQAQNSLSVGLDRVDNTSAGGISTNNQTLNANFVVSGFDLGFNARTVLRSGLDATPDNIANLANLYDRMQATAGMKLGPVNVYGGFGRDSALYGGNSWQYGVAGARTTFNLGPVSAYAGAQARLNWQDAAPSQNTVFAGVVYNFTKNLGVSAGVTKSYGDLKESSYGAALKVMF